MEFQVARLQEIVGKIQYYSKLNFRNAIDVDLVLEAEGLDIFDINKLIGAGVRMVGFNSMEQFIALESDLLPCKRYYTGPLDGENLSPILANFVRIESITTMEQVHLISDLNVRSGKISDLMVKLNVLSDIKKFGFLPSEIQDICLEIARVSGVRMSGIHTYVPPLDNVKMRKTALRKAGVIYKMLENRFRGIEHFSMNYMGHFEDLLAEGVNEIRIGIKNLA